MPRLTLAAAVPAHVRAPGPAPRLPWPATGEAAVGVDGLGGLAGTPAQRPVPIASVAKVMTAYVVLHDHPLAPAAAGPALTMTPADVAAYRAGAAAQESVLAVAAGERLSEQQALQALLIASANNIADALARWDAGSTAAFVAKMNATASALGMTHTRYTDPSGYAPSTVSTADDQLLLAAAAMHVPALRAIVALPVATFPIAGAIYNYNALVGHDGFVGIKTGSTTAAQGCLLFAADRTLPGGRRVLVVGAVLGARGVSPLDAVRAASKPLADAAPGAVRPVTVLPAGSTVGVLRTAWGASAPVVTAAPVRMLGFTGALATLHAAWAVPAGSSVAAGAAVGDLTVRAGGSTVTVRLVAGRAVRGPGLRWRLTRVP